MTNSALLWSKTYKELPEGFYTANIGEYGHLFIFQAMPNRGDWVVEGLSKNLDELIAKAERFAKGEEKIEGFYVSSL